MTILVQEIFYSIQGEGILTGEPTVFVRLAGCSLCCSWCDTPYAQYSEQGQEMSVDQVVKKVRDLTPDGLRPWVCITGGEPLLQEEGLKDLVKGLSSEFYRVTIETNGSIKPPRWCNLIYSWNADIKCPSSGMCGKSDLRWFRMRISDQIKFVVKTKEDFIFVRETLKSQAYSLPRVLVSPVGTNGQFANQELLKNVAELCKEVGARYSLQIHKIIWGNKIGV